MATLGGTEAISLEDEIGAITPGRRADLIQVRLGRPHMMPLYDVVAHLLYAADAADVVTVIVDGKRLMDSGRVLTIDRKRVRSKATETAKEIRTWLDDREARAAVSE
jgi:5-methylthioadenosine/S-adenosylhomocysteine deaminase